MKKQVTLITKDGLVYAVNLAVSLVDGTATIESCVKTAQLFGNFKPVTEKTLSVKAENGPKKYLVSLVKVDDEFEAVIDDITTEKVKPLWQVIAGKSKLSLAVYNELWSISHEFDALYQAINSEEQEKAVDTARENSLYRAALKVADSITKQNLRNGSAYTVENFISACLTLAL